LEKKEDGVGVSNPNEKANMFWKNFKTRHEGVAGLIGDHKLKIVQEL